MKQALAVLCLAAAPFIAIPVHAQDRREFREQDRYRSPHWVYDNRYRHAHYYPALGYAVPILPEGNIAVTFGGGRLFFHGGVWFRAAGASYVVVRPPFGVVVPVLPPDYTAVYSGGRPYYYANEIYYSPVPGGAGYAVVAPPPGAEPTMVQQPVPPPESSPQPGQAPSSASQPSAGVWYYCESAKAYYPYVADCREGWRQVPASPPPGR
jgi:hypothetical protein